MRRREFITLIGGAAAWPLRARAQQPERMRRVGVLIGGPANDPVFSSAWPAFLEGLKRLGWAENDKARIELRSGFENAEIRKSAAELVALAPDVLFVSGTAAVGPLVEAAGTTPVVFVNVPDPVAAGYVKSLARPGGNVTGLTNFEYGLSGKWLELLKEISPSVRRAAVLRDPTLTSGSAQFAAIQAVAPSLGVEITPVDIHDSVELERSIAGFAEIPNGGLVVTQSGVAIAHRDLIIRLAARYKLPGIYITRLWAASGGLMSYGADVADQFRRSAAYVDQILKGAKPADLPVQTPTKYELVINLKTANALGLSVPPTLQARADELIE
jgi:putative tryptophan/tyrosine transport system substrate-binding protein